MLWQPIDAHALGLPLPAMAPQHILCQDHCAVSGSGQRGPQEAKFKAQDLDNVPYWTACGESIMFYLNYIESKLFLQLH